MRSQMFTGKALRDTAVALYGYRWAVMLADQFHTTPKTVRCWARNLHMIPADMRSRMIGVLEKRIGELERVKDVLVSNSNDT